MSWRYYLKDVDLNPDLPHVYEFGVYTGQSMVDIGKVLEQKGVIPTVMWGFDSFEGLPESDEPLFQECWRAGNFSSKSYFSENNTEKCIEILYNIVSENINSDTEVKMVKGFYEDVLSDTLKDELGLMPAVYVDLDCDLYSSTVTCLDFLCQNDLLAKGTIVGFDDIGGVYGWKTCSFGQARAWKEAREKYNIDADLLVRVGDGFPHVHEIWQIKSG